MDGDIHPIGLLLNIKEECAPVWVGVEGSYFVTGELTKKGWKAALGAMVCGGEVLNTDHIRLESSSPILATVSIGSWIPNIDLDRAGLLMLILCG